jgi:hypothetical protein
MSRSSQCAGDSVKVGRVVVATSSLMRREVTASEPADAVSDIGGNEE